MSGKRERQRRRERRERNGTGAAFERRVREIAENEDLTLQAARQVLRFCGHVEWMAGATGMDRDEVADSILRLHEKGLITLDLGGGGVRVHVPEELG